MSPCPKILEILGSILIASRQVLALAQAENWDHLVEHEKSRCDLIDRLREHTAPASPPLAPDQQTQVNALLQEILRLNEEIETLVQHRLGDIKGSFQSIDVSRRLNKTYGAP